MAERAKFSTYGAQIKLYEKSFSIDGKIVHIGSPGDVRKLQDALDALATKVAKETRREIREALGIELKINVER